MKTHCYKEVYLQQMRQMKNVEEEKSQQTRNIKAKPSQVK